jgi:hypothetical protein
MTNLAQSHKITPAHLARRAIVYLRQSSDRQVRENTESQRLQYALAPCNLLIRNVRPSPLRRDENLRIEPELSSVFIGLKGTIHFRAGFGQDHL